MQDRMFSQGRRNRTFQLVLTFLLIGLAGRARAGVHNIRLSDDSKVPVAIDLFRQSPDGRWIVYKQGRTLYRVPTGQGDPAPLLPNLPASDYPGNNLVISPDSRYVVFPIGHLLPGETIAYDLYCVGLEGGSPVRLTESATAGSFPFTISPDSRWVVFARCDEDRDEKKELFSVPLGGGPNRALTEYATGYLEFDISPDSQRVVYSWQDAPDVAHELRSVLIGGGTSVVLAPADPLYSARFEFAISPDSRQVVYTLQDQSHQLAQSRLSVVPIGGGTPKVLDQATGSNRFNCLLISTDSRTVAYVRVYKTDIGYYTIEISPGNYAKIPYYNDYYNLDRVSLAGGSAQQINPPLKPDTSAQIFRISPDGQSLVYQALLEGEAKYAYYLLSLTSGEQSRVSDPADPSLTPNDCQWSPDGTQLVYSLLVFDSTTTGTSGPAYRLILDTMRAGGGRPTRVYDSLKPIGPREEFRVVPDGSRVILKCNPAESVQTGGIFSIPLNGGATTQLNPNSSAGGTISDWSIAPDGRSVYFLTSDDADQPISRICRVAITGGPATRLDQPVNDYCLVQDFKVTPDEQAVLFRANIDLPMYTYDLYSVSTAGGPCTRLTTINGDFRNDYRITADSRHVVYVSNVILYSIPVRGTAATRLSDALPNSIVTNYELTPDGARVVYTEAEYQIDSMTTICRVYSVAVTGGNPVQLYQTRVQPQWLISPDSRFLIPLSGLNEGLLSCIPLDGGPAMQLPVRPNFDINAFDVPPTERLVWSRDSRSLYAMSTSVDGQLLIEHLPVSGGAPTTTTLPREPDVRYSMAQMNPASGRAIYNTYKTNPDGSVTDALFSVSIDGGTPVRFDLPATGSARLASNVMVSPDGRRVVFTMNVSYEPIQLYSMPIEGGAAVSLSGPMEPGWSLASTFDISPDNGMIIYRAYDGGLMRLFSVPIDGGPRLLLGEFLNNHGEPACRLSRDGRNVAFRGDSAQDGLARLFCSPVMWADPVQVSGTPVSGEGVGSDYWIGADGSLLIYRADQGENGLHLYATRLGNAIEVDRWTLYQ